MSSQNWQFLGKDNSNSNFYNFLPDTPGEIFFRVTFSFQKWIFCSLSKFWKYIGGLRMHYKTYFILIVFDEYIIIWYCDVVVKIRAPKFSGKNIYGQKIVKTHLFSPNPGVSRSFEKEKVTAFSEERLFDFFILCYRLLLLLMFFWMHPEQVYSFSR